MLSDQCFVLALCKDRVNNSRLQALVLPYSDVAQEPCWNVERFMKMSNQRKRPGIAFGLALALPVVAVMGAGHFYAGSLWRGVVLLAVGWVLVFLWLLFLLASGTVVGDTNATIFLVLSLLVLIGYGGLWAWQAQDARRLLQPRRPALDARPQGPLASAADAEHQSTPPQEPGPTAP